MRSKANVGPRPHLRSNPDWCLRSKSELPTLWAAMYGARLSFCSGSRPKSERS